MPKAKAPWFVRFVVHEQHWESGRRMGLFHAARDLSESTEISPDERDRLDSIAGWFADNLEKPDRFSLSAKANKKGQAISWFKESAIEHIAQIRAMILILEAHGVAMETLRTQRPGYVVYEDEHQVTAYPFADTPT